MQTWPGKSTFLRTVGTNILLAEIGAPVCAASMKIRPVDLYTNMRTTDSLLKDESYFFAELKRIKAVLDRLVAGEQIFVILDEMLKGTNSVDKLNGSKELVRKLAQYQCAAMIATHDLKLSEMAKELPERVFNKCFEIRIENNELIFDYKLSDGVTQTMNATFLMKKWGLFDFCPKMIWCSTLNGAGYPFLCKFYSPLVAKITLRAKKKYVRV